jgi:Cell wall-active antibiotics response 4TMS YvqF
MSLTPPARSSSFALFGGLRRDGRFATGSRLTHAAVIGGISLDLREADLPADGVTITKVSAVGGVSLVVPRGVQVQVGGFTLFGGKNVRLDAPAAADAPTVRVRAFGLVGGVRVRAAE